MIFSKRGEFSGYSENKILKINWKVLRGAGLSSYDDKLSNCTKLFAMHIELNSKLNDFNEFKRENLALVSMTLPSCLFNHVPHLMLQHTVYTLLPIQTADTSLSVCCTTCHEVNLKISFHSFFLSLLFLFKGVSGIVGRAEILACTFFSLSFLSYHKYVQNFFLSMNIFFYYQDSCAHEDGWQVIKIILNFTATSLARRKMRAHYGKV